MVFQQFSSAEVREIGGDSQERHIETFGDRVGSMGVETTTKGPGWEIQAIWWPKLKQGKSIGYRTPKG